MAMSLKKIGAIAVGGAMVASALASGAMAATTSGDVSAFMKDAVKDGQPNVNIVVGENAATSDVVSASDIAAKIGSMCYKTGTVEDGSAEIKVSADAKSDDIDLWDDDEVKNGTKAITMVTSADSDYSEAFVDDVNDGKLIDGSDLLKMTNNVTVELGDLSTLTEVEDIDPLDWYDESDHNAAEFLIGTLTPGDDKSDFNITDISADVKEDNLFWAAFNINDSEDSLTKSPAIKEGQLIPLLGQTKVLVKADEEDEILYLGDEAYSGVLKDGESFDVGNGYSVKINSVLKDSYNGSTIYKVDVAILKDGTKVESMFKTAPDSLVYKDVGVHIEKAWTDVGEDYGYAELVITKNTQAIELGEEPIKDWEAWAVAIDSDDDKLVLSKKFDNDNNGKLSVGNDTVIGIALKYVGDDEEDIDNDEKVSIAGYADLEFDEDDSKKLNIFYSMDKSMEVTLDVGQKAKVLNAEVKLNDLKASAQEVMPVTAPIAKLDSEVTLDTADKNLILVGGPVVNKLAEALQTAGKITIDNTSPATLAVVGDAANGNDVLVVAGGDRDATRAAALDLIKDY